MNFKLKSFAISISVVATVATSTLGALAMHPNKPASGGQSTSGDMTIQKELEYASFTLKVLQANLEAQIETCGQAKYEYSKLERVINERLEELYVKNPQLCVFNPQLIENQARFLGFTKKELLEFEQKKINKAQKKVDEEQERINKAQKRYDELKEQYDSANILSKDNQN